LQTHAKQVCNFNQLNSCSAIEIWSDPNRDWWNRTEVDIYSFGMILWELETGEVPFDGLSSEEVRTKLLHEQLRP
jgi:serine/threonine protein kinase